MEAWHSTKKCGFGIDGFIKSKYGRLGLQKYITEFSTSRTPFSALPYKDTTFIYTDENLQTSGLEGYEVYSHTIPTRGSFVYDDNSNDYVLLGATTVDNCSIGIGVYPFAINYSISQKGCSATDYSVALFGKHDSRNYIISTIAQVSSFAIGLNAVAKNKSICISNYNAYNVNVSYPKNKRNNGAIIEYVPSGYSATNNSILINSDYMSDINSRVVDAKNNSIVLNSELTANNLDLHIDNSVVLHRQYNLSAENKSLVFGNELTR